MAYAFRDDGVLDYAWCTYGTSRMLFRGPARDLTGTYISVLGGADCFGRFVQYPFPSLLEEAVNLPVANLAGTAAGPDYYLASPEVLAIAANSAVTVVHVMGDYLFSNRYFTVHPRRNDRFVDASPALRDLYPQLDFTDYNFTGHLLSALCASDAGAFLHLLPDLRADWVARMQLLLRRTGNRTILLTVEDAPGALDPSVPGLVDDGALQALAPFVQGQVHARISDRARADGLSEMIFEPMERTLAGRSLNPGGHRDILAALLPRVEAELAAILC